MKLNVFPLLLTLLAATLPVKADLAVAEKLLREGKPAEALAELELKPHSPAALYWKGRVLVELNRLPQAVAQFCEVPADSVFYPYAAKAIIYCAWLSPALDFVEQVAPLTASPDSAIATLAQAALAEHQLRNTIYGDTSTLEPLRKLAEKDDTLKPMVQLLNIEEMRRSARYTEAIEACRHMEADPQLPQLMKQRVRLALAEIYYDKAAAAAKSPIPPTEEELDDMETDEGKGEETLMHFISANPDSPLLEEAFRRLDGHGAFSESEYARRKLTEWSEELSKPRRAAMALAVRQRMQLLGNSQEAADVTYANTAATAIPNEPVSQLIISEQIRRLINSGNISEASLYLNMLEPNENDPRYLFYKACCQPHDRKETVELFRKSADLASTDLQPAALCNAMYSAMLNGDQAVVDELLTKELPTRARRALLLMHAGLILHKNPAQARAEIDSAVLLEPTRQEQVEIMLQLAELDLETDPTACLNRLQSSQAEERMKWTEEQALRFYSLRLQATEKLHDKNNVKEAQIEILQKALAETKRKDVHTALAINLANTLSQCSRHTEALELLKTLVQDAENTTLRARAMLLAGRQAEKLNSLEYQELAASYFQQASELNTPLKNKAVILQARVLAWINRGEKALTLLNNLLRSAQLTPTDRAMALSVLGHVQTLEGTEEATLAAIECCNKIFEIEGLAPEWLIRANIQRAALYARACRTDEAIKHYLNLVDSTPRDISQMTKAKWFILYFAGAGAVSQYIEKEQFEQAAEMAEKLAAWPHIPEKGTHIQGSGARAEQFLHWAETIRKFNYLPSTKAVDVL
ncbi:MAG: hypothetical protein Q4F35_07100 [Akkermansia sp.]|nr:hypothetical protein [Akkermansia sp.]